MAQQRNFFTFPFLAHSPVLCASLYLHVSPPPFLPPFSLLTLRCKCLAPPVALTERRISKTRFSSLPMHQHRTTASLPSHADKCARSNQTAINSHYPHRLRLKHSSVYFVQSYQVLLLLHSQFQLSKTTAQANRYQTNICLKKTDLFKKKNLKSNYKMAARSCIRTTIRIHQRISPLMNHGVNHGRRDKTVH